MGYITKRQVSGLAAGLVAALLAGCENATPTSRVEPLHTHTSYMPFVGMSTKDGVSSVNSISAVNGSDPSKILPLDSLDKGDFQVFDHGHFHTGKYDPKTFKISQFHMTTLIYSRSDALRRLDLAEPTAPVSVQVSSESNASNICHESMVRGNDFVNQDNSRLVYRVGDCETGAWHLVRLGMSPTTLPIVPPPAISKVVEGVYNAQTAALDGWIAVEGGTLKRFDPDFALPGRSVLVGSTPVAVSNKETVAVLSQLADGHTVLVSVDGRVLRYDQSTDQAVVLSDSPGGEIWDYASDGEALYFFVYTPVFTPSDGTMTLYRMPLTGANSVATELMKEVAGIRVTWWVMTTNYFGYVLADKAPDVNGKLLGYKDYQIKMVHKTSGAAPVAVLGPEGARGLVNIRGVGSKVYVFTMDSTMRANPSMRVIDETNLTSGGTVEAGYRFAGETYSDVFDATRNIWEIKTLMLQKDRRIVAYDPFLAAVKFNIGQLAVGESGVVNLAWARGHQYGLMTVASFGSDWGRIFFYDAEKADSLVSVISDSDHMSVNHKPAAVRQKAGSGPSSR